jgi:hypothetical protein
MTAFLCQCRAALPLLRRRLRYPRDEAGITTIEWLGLGFMVLLVIIGLSPDVRALGRDVLTAIRERILGQG